MNDHSHEVTLGEGEGERGRGGEEGERAGGGHETATVCYMESNTRRAEKRKKKQMLRVEVEKSSGAANRP